MLKDNHQLASRTRSASRTTSDPTFCFALPDDATLDLLPGDHLYVHATIDGKPVKRPYMPSSTPGITGLST